MKPAMARLCFEAVAFIKGSSERIAKAHEVAGHFGADDAASMERIRNALSRLCASRHLKKISDGYAYLRDFEPEPPPVGKLFPERSAPAAKSDISVEKGSGNPLGGSPATSSDGEPPPSGEGGRPSSPPEKAAKGAVQEWILQKLEEAFPSSLTTSDLCDRALDEGASASRGAVQQCLSVLYRKERIDRPERGRYRSLDPGEAGTAPPDPDGAPQAAFDPSRSGLEVTVAPQPLPEGLAGTAGGDIEILDRYVASWRQELALTESRASELRTRIAEYERIIKWRREALEWCTDTVEDEPQERKETSCA